MANEIDKMTVVGDAWGIERNVFVFFITSNEISF